MRERTQINTSLGVAWPVVSVVCLTLTLWLTMTIFRLAKTQRERRLLRSNSSMTQSPTASSTVKYRFRSNSSLSDLVHTKAGVSTGIIISIICAITFSFSQVLRLITAIMVSIRIFWDRDNAKDKVTSELPISGPNQAIFILSLFFQNVGYFTYICLMFERLHTTFIKSVYRLDVIFVRLFRLTMVVSGFVMLAGVSILPFSQILATQIILPLAVLYPISAGSIIIAFRGKTLTLAKEMLSMGVSNNVTTVNSLNSTEEGKFGTNVESNGQISSLGFPALKNDEKVSYTSSQVTEDGTPVSNQELDGNDTPVHQTPVLNSINTVHSESDADPNLFNGTDIGSGSSEKNAAELSRNGSVSAGSISVHRSQASILRMNRVITLLETSLKLSICCTTAIMFTFCTLVCVVSDRQLVTVSPLSMSNLLLITIDPCVSLFCLLCTFGQSDGYYRFVFGLLHRYCFHHLQL